MKKLLLILTTLFCFNIKAQYVTIPDAKFAAWLQTNIPSAMIGNQMDTTNAILTSYTTLNVAGDSIGNLTGIQYFDALKVLDCGNSIINSGPNYLTTLPKLPATLDTLICGNNQLTSLPTLPTSLIELDCRYNQITSLPAIPNSLLILSCISNQLTNLPALPNTLTSLDFGYNLVTTISAFPDSLTALGCYENQLTSLPAFPNNITGISCEGNLLTKLPALPSMLSYLDCNFNQIDTLPNLPATLVFLFAGYNNLTYVPSLPSSLKVLECHENQITSLPPLPNTLTTFLCYNNQITCFAPISSAIATLDIHNNPFTCLPNYTPYMDSVTHSFPLCVTGNANGCPASCVPSLTLTSNKYTICKGDSQLLSVSGADLYTWSPGGTLSDSTSASPYAKPNATTIYTVVGTSTNTSCGNGAPLTVTVTINNIQVNSVIMCVGGTATLTAAGANTYTWSTGANTATITASPTVTTNYTVTGTDSANCIITDTTAITITTVNVAAPVLSGSTNPITICQGAPVTINVTSDSNSVAVWYQSNNIINHGNSYTPSTLLADTIVYTITDSSTVLGCSSAISSPLTFSLIINPLPSQPNITDSSFIHCPSTSFSPINATGSGAIMWYANSTSGAPLYVGNSYTPASLPVGTTYLFVRDSSLINACVNPAIDSIYITINQMHVSIASTCAGGTATLLAGGVNTYTWSTGANTATITASPTVTTSYTVSGTDLGNCLFTDTTQIIVNAPISLTPPVLGFSNILTTCQGASVYLNVTPDSTSTPVWYLNNSMVNVGNQYYPSTAVADTVVYTVIDSLAIAGCASVVSSASTFSLIIKPVPSAPVISDTSGVYCHGKSPTVLHAAGSGAIEWLVNGYPVYVGNTYTITSPPLGTTYYFALDSSTTNSCFNAHADSIYITILPDSLPTVSFQLIPDSVPHVYSIDAYYSANVISAKWYWGDGTDTVSINPVHTYDSAGVYNICVTAFNACGDSVHYCQSDSVFRTAGNTIISVHVIEVTGIATTAAQSSVIKIYPNPANNKITIDANDVVEVKLFDVLGKQITSTKENQIDVSNLQNGVYFIQVQTNTSTTIQKIMVQH
jgi:hypothetical protein